MKEHYPPMEHFYNVARTEVDVHLDMPSVQQIGNHAHCVYDQEVGARLKADFDAQRPVVFPEAPKVCQYEETFFYSSGQHFHAMFGAGVVQEHDFVTGEISRLISVPHKVMVMKTLDSWETDETGELSKVQQTVREHHYMHVWLGKDLVTNKRFLIPPNGTWMHIDPVDERARKHVWSQRRRQWFGYVVDPIDNAVKELAPDFTIFVRKPRGARWLKTFDSLKPPIWLPKAMLVPFFDRKTEERQLYALQQVCNVRSIELHHLAFPLFFQPERYGRPPVDWRVGPDPADPKTELWDSLLGLMVQYRGMEANKYHMEIMKSYAMFDGHLSLITGAAGTAKTTLVTDSIVLMNLVGHKVWVVGEQQDAVDNIANAFWVSYNLALEKTRQCMPNVHDMLKKKRYLRYE